MGKLRKQLKDLGVEIPDHFYKKWTVDPFIPAKTRGCDHPTCANVGEYRAPQSRENLGSYYWFCLEHVRDYNAAWDYYAGLSPLEIERALRFGQVWERPTWPLGLKLKGSWRGAEESLRSAFEQSGVGRDEAGEASEEPKAKFDMGKIDPRYKAQLEALHELGLDPPVDFEAIKKRYRLLVKRHHPDAKAADGKQGTASDDRIKRLNSAFTVLKAFYAVEEGP